MSIIASGLTKTYPALRETSERHPGRWSDATLAGARAAEGLGHLSSEEWVEILDECHAGLATILPEGDRPRRGVAVIDEDDAIGEAFLAGHFASA